MSKVQFIFIYVSYVLPTKRRHGYQEGARISFRAAGGGIVVSPVSSSINSNRDEFSITRSLKKIFLNSQVFFKNYHQGSTMFDLLRSNARQDHDTAQRIFNFCLIYQVCLWLMPLFGKLQITRPVSH